jgi:hypothetical protein
MSTIVYVLIGVIVVVAVIAILAAVNQRRSGRLRTGFGPEYDRVVQATGDRRVAEKELAGRVERRKNLNIVPLPEATRQQYLVQWQQVQAAFVDAPVQSVQQADALVARVMTDRGYPMAEFEQRADDISVDHPSEVADYRAAHALSLNGPERASTEDLRQAMTHYRALFNRLLAADGSGGDSNDGGAGRPAAATARREDSVAPATAPPPPTVTADSGVRPAR